MSKLEVIRLNMFIEQRKQICVRRQNSRMSESNKQFMLSRLQMVRDQGRWFRSVVNVIRELNIRFVRKIRIRDSKVDFRGRQRKVERVRGWRRGRCFKERFVLMKERQVRKRERMQSSIRCRRSVWDEQGMKGLNDSFK